MSKELFTQQEIAPLENLPVEDFSVPHPVENTQEGSGFFNSRDDANAPDTLTQKDGGGKKRFAGFTKLRATRLLTFVAVLTALSVVTKMISIDIGLGKLSFFYIPVFIAGALFGPWVGMLVGCLGEVLGSTIQYGSPEPFTVIGNTLMGLWPGLSFYFIRTKSSIPKFVVSAVFTLIFTSYLFNTLGLINPIVWGPFPGFTVENFIKALLVPTSGILPRIVFQPLVLTANMVAVFFLHNALLRVFFKDRISKESD